MAGKLTLGKAYVQIMPSADGITNKLKNIVDPATASAGKSGGLKLGGAMIKGLAIAGVTAAVTKVVKDSIAEGAKLEQSIGGIETLFKDSAKTMRKYASEAYKTVGVSQNEYMENVTSFSASLLQSLGGDTAKAAEIANRAMIDMGDNANKMGTDMASIQNAYQGFAKQNYTMLDNLKLGYGGTKKEMERLLADATKLTGVKYNIDNLADVYQAVGVIQEQLGITGTTALEAEETISGSLNAMKASFQNALGNLAIGENIHSSMKQLAESISTFLFKNFIPMVVRIVSTLPTAIISFVTAAIPEYIKSGAEMISSLSKGFTDNLVGFGEELKTAIPVAIDSLIELVDTSIQFIINEFPKFIKSGLELVTSLARGIINNLPFLIEKGSEIIARLLKTIGSNYPKFIGEGLRLMGELAIGLVKAVPGLVAKIPSIIVSILRAFGSLGGALFSVGQDMIRGLWNGINNVKSWILGKISGFVDSVMGGIKKFFGIKSPSRVMANEVGKYLPSGLAVGIEANTKPLMNTMEDLSIQTVDSFNLDSTLGRFNTNDIDNTYSGVLQKLTDTVDRLLNNPPQYQMVTDTGVLAGEMTQIINKNLQREADNKRRGG